MSTRRGLASRSREAENELEISLKVVDSGANAAQSPFGFLRIQGAVGFGTVRQDHIHVETNGPNGVFQFMHKPTGNGSELR